MRLYLSVLKRIGADAIVVPNALQISIVGIADSVNIRLQICCVDFLAQTVVVKWFCLLFLQIIVVLIQDNLPHCSSCMN